MAQGYWQITEVLCIIGDVQGLWNGHWGFHWQLILGGCKATNAPSSSSNFAVFSVMWGNVGLQVRQGSRDGSGPYTTSSGA